MIKINKSLLITDVPHSLRPPFKAHFAPHNIPRAARTTFMRRNELIRGGTYTDADIYNSRYKLQDIKKALSAIYKNKCVYCEQKLEQFHVEHYRPKQVYYWLAFSWDNLIVACQFCNEFKGINFQIKGPAVALTVSLNNLKQINSLSAAYDITEQPDLVNPEITDPRGMLRFATDGDVSSVNARFHYTIVRCRISRTYLKDRRRKLLDDLRRDLRAALVENKAKADQAIALKAIISKFKRDANDMENEFIAFRRFVIDHWLKNEIKQIAR